MAKQSLNGGDKMYKIDTKVLLLKIFAPAVVFSSSYLVLGLFCSIPHILLFCILGTFLLVPAELAMILKASKSEYGEYSLRSAFAGQEKPPICKTLAVAFIFFIIAGLLSVLIAPVENQLFAGLRSNILNRLPGGFDWTNYEYLKAFSRPVRIITCVYYAAFNVFVAPITEELFFRGYLTSHYEKQTPFTPIIITVLFSLYHLWLPFNNLFRIFAFAPAAYLAYKKKNIYISICFHCLCNLFSTLNFILVILG